jgi:hypothetical protein
VGKLLQVDGVGIKGRREKYNVAGFAAATNWSIPSTVLEFATPDTGAVSCPKRGDQDV